MCQKQSLIIFGLFFTTGQYKNVRVFLFCFCRLFLGDNNNNIILAGRGLISNNWFIHTRNRKQPSRDISYNRIAKMEIDNREGPCAMVVMLIQLWYVHYQYFAIDI
jgi:hypothetical protein